MHSRDINAIGTALAEGLGGTASRVEEIHQAFARRSFGAVGPAGNVPEAIYDGISGRVYSTISKVGPTAIKIGTVWLASIRHPEAPGIHHGRNGRAMIGAVNGVFGDTLAKRRNGLAIRMSVRVDGHDVALTPEALAQAFPDATPRVVVFVHGFGETDDSWLWYANAHWDDAEVNYGSLLQRELGYTPVYVRYNSGKPIEENGRELSELLELLSGSWPGGLRELAIVGHSYGAIVAGEAVWCGYDWDARWVQKASHVFALSSPRHAERVELVTRATERALSRLPETKPLADLLDSRSPGLKGLAERAPHDALPGRLREVQLPAAGIEVSHFRLLNHPAIYQQIKAELTARTAPAPARAVPGARLERAARALRSRRRSRRR